jgi:hypothetical protein
MALRTGSLGIDIDCASFNIHSDEAASSSAALNAPSFPAAAPGVATAQQEEVVCGLPSPGGRSLAMDDETALLLQDAGASLLEGLPVIALDLFTKCGIYGFLPSFLVSPITV